MNKRICVFDVNETLLDLGALDPLFAKHFGNADTRGEWFGLMLRWSMVLTQTGQYQDFSQIAKASLHATAAKNGHPLAKPVVAEIMDAVSQLPAHSDIKPAFERLRDADIRLAALTNSAQRAVHLQLKHAGLAPYFEKILSVDAVRRFKPDPAVYNYAAQQLGVAPSGLRLVAAHDWDVAGAMQAGCQAAYLDRDGYGMHACASRPDLIASNMLEMADAIIAVEAAT